jgi:hypothetical protein
VAAAEIAPESLPSASITAGVKELSLYGFYGDTPAPFDPKTPVVVKIFRSDEYLEARATVIYSRSTPGMWLAFRDVKPDFRRCHTEVAARGSARPWTSTMKATDVSVTAQTSSCETPTVEPARLQRRG